MLVAGSAWAIFDSWATEPTYRLLEETSCPLFRPPIFFSIVSNESPPKVHPQSAQVRSKSAQRMGGLWADCGRTEGGLFGRTLLGDSLIFGDYLETRDLARATKLGLFFCSVRLRLWAD